MRRRIALAVAVSAALAAGVVSAAAQTSGTTPTSSTLPHLKHVFIVVLENENAGDTFGPNTQIPYLAQTLTSQGAFVRNYYGTGHLSLDNYISMVSGQGPNIQTQSDCQFYSKFLPGTPTSNGQYIGQGCVYPPGVQNIATQLEGNGYTWKGYMQDMANSAPAQPASCRHPAFNTQDSTQSATAGDQYAARHNPFVYFESIIDFATCQQNDVDLGHLSTDLASASTTPDYSFITPDLCNDGEQPGPNTPNAGGPIPGPGGGRIGAVMLSPCIKPGTVTTDAYNHYSLLRSVEDNFGLPHLGFAGQPGLKPFDSKILDKPAC
jgi:hypothetical protein